MRKPYALFLLIPLLAAGSFATAQTAGMDTLLWENFENDPDTYILPSAPSGDDETWINFDLDGLSDANGRPQEWFWSEGYGEDSVNSVFGSSSWLTGYLDGNRNYLILPPLEIVDTTAMLYWKAYPFQGPRYVEGYSVLVSTATNLETDFSDVLHQEAQMIPPPASGTTEEQLDANNYTFGPGWVFADNFTDSTKFYLDVPTDNSYRCRLIDHSASLAAYEGETIYICFLHDSDDDNLIGVDDILVMGTEPEDTMQPPIGVPEIADLSHLTVWPNPAVSYLNVQFETGASADVALEIRDLHGRTVAQPRAAESVVGRRVWNVDLEDLAPGAYTAVLLVNGQSHARPFVKR